MKPRVRSWIRNLSLRAKLLLMLVPPLVILSGYGTLQVIQRISTAAEMDQVAGQIELVGLANALSEETQRERDLGSLYLGSGGTEFREELDAQRRATDERAAAFVSGIAAADGNPNASRLTDEVASLDAHRAAVDALSIGWETNLSYYTGICDQMFAFTTSLIRHHSHPSLAMLAETYAALEEMAEAAGVERAIIGHAITSGSTAAASRVRLIEVIGAQSVFLDEFVTHASAEQVGYFNRMFGVELAPPGSLMDPTTTDLDAARQAALGGEGMAGFEAAHWWDDATGRIDRIHDVSDILVGELKTTADGLAARARREVVIYAAVALLLVLGGIAAAWVVGGMLVKRTARLTQTAVAIADGQLERRVDDDSRDELGMLAGVFNKMTDRLTQLLHTKDEFVATVSHELRTPLTAVVGFTELLRSESSSLSEAERNEMMETIAHEAFDLSNIVEDLLVAARAEAGSLRVTAVPVDLRAQAAQVLEVLDSPRAAAVKVKGEAPCARGDPARVRQIIRNLLTNACRYGGPQVEIALGQRENSATVEVVDDGPGVSPDAVKLIFEPYYRANPERGVPGSVGLGLAVSRDLARNMGGDLVYRREMGRSVFELSLPAVVSDIATAGWAARAGGMYLRP